MKLKLNKRKNITDIVDSNIIFLGDNFLRIINRVKTIRMFSVVSFGTFVFYRVSFKSSKLYVMSGINTNNIYNHKSIKSRFMDYGLYYSYSIDDYIN